MNEYTIVYLMFGSLIGLAVGSLFYMLGGRADKWLRRFIGSAIIATTVNVASFFMGVWNIWLIGVYPLLILGFSMGYGVDE